MPKLSKREKERLLRAKAKGWRILQRVKRPVSEPCQDVVWYETTRRVER